MSDGEAPVIAPRLSSPPDLTLGRLVPLVCHLLRCLGATSSLAIFAYNMNAMGLCAGWGFLYSLEPRVEARNTAIFLLGTVALFLQHFAFLAYAQAADPASLQAGSAVPSKQLPLVLVVFAATCAGGLGGLFSVRKATAEGLDAEAEAEASSFALHNLLDAMLPGPVIADVRDCLAAGQPVHIAQSFARVNVMQSDIIGFTKLSARLTPSQICDMLNRLVSALSGPGPSGRRSSPRGTSPALVSFLTPALPPPPPTQYTMFDVIASDNYCTKLETIGDAYVAITGGVSGEENPAWSTANAANLAIMAFCMQHACSSFCAPDTDRHSPSPSHWP